MACGQSEAQPTLTHRLLQSWDFVPRILRTDTLREMQHVFLGPPGRSPILCYATLLAVFQETGMCQY